MPMFCHGSVAARTDSARIASPGSRIDSAVGNQARAEFISNDCLMYEEMALVGVYQNSPVVPYPATGGEKPPTSPHP